jgi:nicotinic acid phosphoribosyltransferase
MMQAGWSAENIVFGMGGALLQKVDRDSLKFAMKASAASIDGVWHDVFKDPITDAGKKSKKGRLGVGPGYTPVSDANNTMLDTVYAHRPSGHYFKQTAGMFEDVRERTHWATTKLF